MMTDKAYTYKDVHIEVPKGCHLQGIEYHLGKKRIPRKLKKKLKRDEQSREFWRKAFSSLTLEELLSLAVIK